jgi:hypothetical protein
MVRIGGEMLYANEQSRSGPLPARPEALLPLPHGLVALARHLLELWPVQDRDPSLRIADCAAFGQKTGCDRDPRSTHTEHQGKDFMGEVQFVILGSVVQHQQPPGQSPSEIVPQVANSGLGDLEE